MGKGCLALASSPVTIPWQEEAVYFCPMLFPVFMMCLCVPACMHLCAYYGHLEQVILLSGIFFFKLRFWLHFLSVNASLRGGVTTRHWYFPDLQLFPYAAWVVPWTEVLQSLGWVRIMYSTLRISRTSPFPCILGGRSTHCVVGAEREEGMHILQGGDHEVPPMRQLIVCCAVYAG